MRHVVVLGCGRVGSGIARDLVLRGTSVAVVDTDPATLDRLAGDGITARVVGAASDEGVLRAAGIERADAVAVVTGDDAVNAVVARAVRTVFRVPTVVARLYDPAAAAAYEKLGINTVSPVAWGIRRIAELLTAAEVEPVTALGAGGVEMVDARVPPLLAGRAATEVRVPGEIELVAITRLGRTAFVDAATRLATGDVMHLAVVAGSIGRLESVLGRS